MPQTYLPCWPFRRQNAAPTYLPPALTSQVGLLTMKKYEPLQLGRERALRGQHADDRACTGDRYRRARHTPVHAFARERRRFHTPTLARRSPAAQWKVNGRLVGAGHGGESCHATARRRASGEEQLVQVSSRLILRLSRLKFAFLAVRSVGCGCQAGRALERAATWTAGFLLRGCSRAARTGLYRRPPG